MEVKQFAQGCRAKSSRAGMWTQPDLTPEPMIPHLLSTSGPTLDPSQTQHGERRPVTLLEAPRSMRDGTPRPLGDQDLTPSIPPIPDDQAPSRGDLGSLDHPKQWGLCVWLGRILPRWAFQLETPETECYQVWQSQPQEQLFTMEVSMRGEGWCQTWASWGLGPRKRLAEMAHSAFENGHLWASGNTQE